MKKLNHKVNFDDYSDEYELILQSQLKHFNKDRDYFSSYKVELTKSFINHEPKKILDFGCGTGLSLPHLSRLFPNSQLYATDPSTKCLQIASTRLPTVITLDDPQLHTHKFDLIFIAGVFHHVSPSDRSALLTKIINLLSTDGFLTIFEHNPFNPITNYMVSTCDFDADAQLISKRRMLQLIKHTEALEILKNGYCLFYPRKCSLINKLERKIRFIPAGGQYFVIARKI